MRKIKKGDIVGRISYGKDIFFIVEDIINLNKKENASIVITDIKSENVYIW